MEREFPREAAVKFGWETTKANLIFLVPFMFVMGFFYLVPSFVLEIIFQSNDESILFGIISQILSTCFGVAVQLGMYTILFKYLDGEKGRYQQFFSKFNIYLTYLCTTIVYGLVCMIGFIFCIIPGVYFSMRFLFAPFLVIDKGMSFSESFKKSSELTDGIKWQLLVFSILMLGINLLGVLALIIGLLVSVPVTFLATLYLYRSLDPWETKMPDQPQLPEMDLEETTL